MLGTIFYEIVFLKQEANTLENNFRSHKTTTHIPNKFQFLLSAKNIVPYTPLQRERKTMTISRDYFFTAIIPSLQKAASELVERRVKAIKSKDMGPCVSIVEAVNDRHFRKQRNFGPSKLDISSEISNVLARKESLQLVGLMFTRKNICPLKRPSGDESLVDFAEILSLIQLNSFASLISHFHPHGVKYVLLSEGKRFAKAFNLCLPAVHLYQKRMKRWINELNLKHLELIDYEDFMDEKLSHELKNKRKVEYDKALKLYTELMAPVLSADHMEESLRTASVLDPVKDERNSRNNFVPLWDSIKNSLPYPEIRRLARNRGMDEEQAYKFVFSNILHVGKDVEIEKVRRSVIAKSWQAAIEHNARIMGDQNAGIFPEKLLGLSSFRTTINPKPGSKYLGVYSIRETSSRVQPWHGTAYLQTDGLERITGTALSKFEIESKGGVPVCIDKVSKTTFFYASSSVAHILKKQQWPIFNLSTR